MRKHWKLWFSTLLSVLVLALAVTACGGGDNGGTADDPTPAPTPSPPPAGNVGTEQQPEATPEPTPPPPRDLGGIEINIVSWFNDACTDTFDFAGATILERMRWEDRAYLEEKHNFRMRYYLFGDWSTVRDYHPLELAAGNRDHHIWTLQPSWFLGRMVEGSFAPLPDYHFDGTNGINWNMGLLNLGTMNNRFHGFSNDSEAEGGVAWNMRLLEEAGIPYDYPFTLQREGRWTWDAFLDLARRGQQFNPDGTIRVFGITAFHQHVLSLALPSNNATSVGTCPDTGRATNTTMTREFFEVIELLVQMRAEMLAMHESDVDGEWNAFIDMFNTGHGVFRPTSHYGLGQIAGNLTDPWGFVAFPMGPSGTGHYTETVGGNVFAIPHYFSEEEVDKFLYAWTLWHRPLPGAEDDDWILFELARMPDPRSVLETMVNYTNNPQFQRFATWRALPVTISMGESFAWRVWADNEPAVIIEEAQAVWDEYIARANAALGFDD